MDKRREVKAQTHANKILFRSIAATARNAQCVLVSFNKIVVAYFGLVRLEIAHLPCAVSLKFTAKLDLH